MGEAPADHRPYVFGDVVVDPRGHRVLRGTAEIALEPKAFAVLLVLLREVGSIVPRDSLLDEVWGHRHVTPAVLNRVIAMLRRALGDDADHPRLIRTVYGTGYGFVGAVSRGDLASAPAAAEAPAALAAAATSEVAQEPEALRVPQAVDASSAPPPSSTEPPSPQSATLPLPVLADRVAAIAPPPRRHAPAAIVTLLALAIVVGVLVWHSNRSEPEAEPEPVAQAAADAAAPRVDPTGPSTDADAPLRVAVLPLRAETPGEAADDLAAGLTDGLIESLSRQPRIAVTARESSERVDASDPSAALQALGVDRVVAGRLTLRDDGIVAVDISLHRAQGMPAWTQRYERPRAQVFRLLGPLLDDLRDEALPIGSEAGLRALNTASERVQDLYGEASLQLSLLLQRANPQSRAETVLASIDRLIAEDPDFAPGHAMRATLFTRMANMGAIDLETASREAKAAADRAIALDPDLLEGHIATGFIATMQWRSIEAIGPAQRALELAPNDYRSLSLMGNVLAYTGRVDEARDYTARANALNPLMSQVIVRHGWSKVLEGNRDAALAAVDRFERDVGMPIPIGSRIRTLVAFGEPGRALAEHGQRVEQEAAIAGFARAAALQVLGETASARTELDAIAPKLPIMPFYIDLRLREALLEGDAAGFVAGLDAAPVPMAQSPWLETLRATALAHGGDTDAALRAFGRVFAEPRNRELLVYSWFATHSGISFLTDWIALRRAAGMSHAAELAAHDAFLKQFIDGGVKAPMLLYHRAVSAALHEDAATSDQLLGEAITAGWLDPIALRFDLAWAPYADADWLAARRAEVAALVLEQRKIAGLP